MAIYHFSAKVISRANGSSAVAAAAYRSASRLEDERLGRGHDFSNKSDVVHSEIMAPEGSPERWQDREVLWNEVELGEARKDAQLAREVEFSIPREMSQSQGVELARDFVQSEFVDRGMVADLNVHWDIGPDGLAKPHAHVMLSMREVTGDAVTCDGVTRDGVDEAGFGKKVREWNSRELLTDWREAWSGHVNARLAELGIEAQIDHRSLAAQGIGLEPQHKIGPAGMRREDRGEEAERAADHRQIARRNGEKIIAEPSVALDAITRQQSTFTDHDLARLVHRHTDDKDQFDRAMGAVRGSPELVALGRDGRGRERFSTREMLATEQGLERSAERIAERRGHGVSGALRGRAEAGAKTGGLELGEEQRDALAHVTHGGDLSLVVGYAGTGKSAMLGVAREGWEAAGYTVRGAALSGIAAESLEAGSGIGSRTIASLEHSWGQGRELLGSGDVLVIDEAGMIGSRQMARVLSAVETAGAKVVLVGDAEQLQAIEAGAAFRALTERHGAAEISTIRRQREDWQRDATRELATGATSDALDRYEAAGRVVGHQTREGARRALVEGWDAGRRVSPEASQIMLAHTRADVAELNQLARERMRDGRGASTPELGDDQVVQTERGARAFASGDRLMFLRNERSLGVKNGSLGTVERVDPTGLTVRLDGVERRSVSVELKDYAHIDHGYASTIHKSQGVTVDHSHVLATDGLDRHAAYVAMSRHRETLSVHYGADDFKDRDALVRALGRERAKDTTLDYPAGDYPAAFAERRGLVRSQIEVPAEVQRPALRKRGMFDGLKLGGLARSQVDREGLAGLRLDAGELRAPGSGAAAPPVLDRAARDYASAFVDIEAMRGRGQSALPDQEIALKRAGRALAERDPGAAADLRSALTRNPGLAAQAVTPEGMERIAEAVGQEARVRASPELRAERFAEAWRGLESQRARLGALGDREGRSAVEGRMGRLADGLARDPQMESLLRTRGKALGLPVRGGQDLARELTRSLGLGRGLGR